MNRWIHNSAKVHESAILRPGVWIGPNVTIEAGVVIGHNAVIGGPPEHRDFYDDIDGELSKGVIIKAGARIFEFVTVHAGTRHPTYIGEGAAVFNKSHIAHDVYLDKGSTVGGQCSLAGHVHMQPMSQLSGKSCVSQFVVIGAYAFVCGFSFLTQHAPVGSKWAGAYSKMVGVNEIGLQRAGLELGQVQKLYNNEFEMLTIGRKI